MSDVYAEVSKIHEKIRDLVVELAEVCDELDEGDIITDVVVIAGTFNPSNHLAGVLYYARPETPAYTIRGLLTCADESMMAVTVADEVESSGWDGDMGGWDGTP